MTHTSTSRKLMAYNDLQVRNRPDELWREIPGLEGLYQISNHGRVLRMERNIINSAGMKALLPTKIVRPFVRKDRNTIQQEWVDRLQLVIVNERRQYHYLISRLVFHQFVNPFDLSDPLLIVDHKNGDGLDVKPANLELIDYHGYTGKPPLHHWLRSHFETNTAELRESLQRKIYATSTPVAEYDGKGQMIASYESVSAAIHATGHSDIAIKSALKHQHRRISGNFWRYGSASQVDMAALQEINYRRWVHQREKSGKPVTQFDMKGNILASYAAKSVAAKLTGVSHKTISEHLENPKRYAGGFYWKKGNLLHCDFSKAPFLLNSHPIDGKHINLWDCRCRKAPRQGTKILQMDILGEIVASYISIAEAARSTRQKYAAILWALNNPQAKPGGYFWRVEESESEKT